MKKILPAIVMAVMMLASCSDSESEKKEMLTDKGVVTISFMPYEMEAMTRAATPIASFCTRLDVWVAEQGGSTVQQVHQSSSDTDFGTVTMELDKTKTYTLTAVAHKCTAAAMLTDGVIAFPDDRLTHSMVYTTTFSPSASTSLSCLMTRIVGTFRLDITDNVPEGTDRIVMSFNGNDRWNAVTSSSEHAADKVVTVSIPQANIGSPVVVSIFIMPSNLTDTDDVDITVTAYDGDDAEIETKTFADVPIKSGYRTTYRGAFFTTQDMVMTFTADDWSDFDVVEF